ncbi:MAG: hypothetical protein IT182_03025 [Acidobacteria bacterium]|nr:hypothetical protein [Acidobacteriota bacterium]
MTRAFLLSSRLRHVVFAAVCLSAAPAPVCAQRAAAQPATLPPQLFERGAEQAPLPASDQRADDTRNQLRELLQQHPPAVREVLQRQPTLLTNADYLAPYPRLGAFIAAHPEIVRSPGYFLGEPQGEMPDDSGRWMWRELLSALSAGTVMLGVCLAFGWLVRTALDHRRWQRVAKVQVETHTKLLDRMTTSEDLRSYMESDAGRQFLESAPIRLDGRPTPLAAPVSRILWSVQVGVVAVCAGVALQFVTRSAIDDVAQPLRVLGVLVTAIGCGFVLSAGIAYALSRKLGLLRETETPASAPWPQA